MSAANAAIFYHPDAFDSSGERLMGRQAAGEAFLKAFVRHSGVDRFHCCTSDAAAFGDFESRVARMAGRVRACDWARPHDLAGLARLGCLYRADPGIGEPAWQRRFLSARAYSLCGVTHTTATAKVMDALGALAFAPLQSWDALICTSRAVRAMAEHVLARWGDYLAERIGARPPIPLQLPVIPLGVDCDAFAAGAGADAARREIRHRFGIADDDVAALFFGRLSFHAKAHPLPMYLGLEAAAKRTGKVVHLIQAGWFANDRIREAFEAGAQSFCPSVRVRFVDGRDPAVRARIWFAADLFTSLSDNVQETFGLVPIEAMAAGLPVVVTDWDGYRDTVRPGIDGFCVATRMPVAGLGEDLAWRHFADIDSYDHYIGQLSQTTAVDIGACIEACAALIEQAELRRKMGAAGRARARERFDWRIVIAAYQALWQELDARRRADSETAPRAKGAPAHPLRDDPYALFAGYPSAPIRLEDEIELVPGADATALSRMRRHEFNSFAAPMLAGDGDCEGVLRHLETRGRCTVRSLLAAFAPHKRPLLHRTLGWLAKVGLVRLPDE